MLLVVVVLISKEDQAISADLTGNGNGRSAMVAYFLACFWNEGNNHLGDGEERKEFAFTVPTPTS